MSGDSDQPAKFPAIAGIILVTILVGVLTLHRIDASDVCSGNEAVEGVFLQQMVEHGELLFPKENGIVPMYKPPLFHWTGVAIARLRGITRVTAADLRAPSALYATAGAALTMLFAYTIIGTEGAILAGLTLAGSYQYIGQGRFGRVDMTLTFFETLALFAFFWWLPSDPYAAGARARVRAHLGALYLMAIAMGLAVLAKGPVGAFLPLISILIFMIVTNRWRQMITLLDPGAIILGGTIASAWYVACYFAGRTEILHRQLGSENAGRFFGSLGAMAPWYYVKPILLNSVPFSLLVPIAVAMALFATDCNSSAQAQESTAKTLTADLARGSARLFAIFWAVTIVFFSLSAYKRRSYLLPVWPGAAVLLAWWILAIPPLKYRRATAWTFGTICCVLAAINFFILPSRETASCSDDSLRPAASEIARVAGPDEPLYLFGFSEEVAPLLFYLDRDAPVITGRLGDAPPGYIVLPASAWKTHAAEAPGLEPVLTSDHGSRHLILLKHGKSYAMNSRPGFKRVTGRLP
ncbi:MAG TPA: phospholipid carrier-dependent glycosyltransferase [Candidatus Binataceae bacterium]|nr:phospholipid carrier-dependent glycosyltransferase [Candidatus Binataceae bacterium]